MESTYERPAAAPATTTDMSVGAWIGTLILTCIPIVNLICLIVWAVSSSPEKRSRKNWAIAQFCCDPDWHCLVGLPVFGNRRVPVFRAIQRILNLSRPAFAGRAFFVPYPPLLQPAFKIFQ